MDNDDATVGRIYTRREALLAATRAGLSLAALGGVARPGFAAPLLDNRPKTPLVASPVLTEGPFFVDEKLNRSDLVTGTTRASVKNGMPLQIRFTAYKLSGNTHTVLKGAHIDVWHADALGVYSDENNPMNHEMTAHQNWLRGYQVTDTAGAAGFKTIFPGWYQGRAPHIHFKIRTYSSASKVTAEFTSQLFFKEADTSRIYASAPYAQAGRHDTTNTTDNIYQERQKDGSAAGDHLLLDLKKLPSSAGYLADFTVVLSDQNLRAGGQRRGPGGPGGPPPFGGPGGSPPPDGFGPPPGGLF